MLVLFLSVRLVGESVVIKRRVVSRKRTEKIRLMRMRKSLVLVIVSEREVDELVTSVAGEGCAWLMGGYDG